MKSCAKGDMVVIIHFHTCLDELWGAVPYDASPTQRLDMLMQPDDP